MKPGHPIRLMDRGLGHLGRFINRIALILCVALAGADLVVVIMEVVTRTAGATFIWTEELSRWLLVWITFVGASVVLKEKGHIRVEFFMTLCPEKLAWFIRLIGEIGVLFFLSFFTVFAWQVAVDALRIKGDIILIPMFYPKLGLVLGGGLMIIHQVHIIVQAMKPRGLHAEEK